MSTNRHDSNGNGDGRHDAFGSLFGGGVIPPNSHDSDSDQVKQKIQHLEYAVARLTVVVAALHKTLSTVKEQLEFETKAMTFLISLVEKALVPLAESVRALKDRDSDLNVLAPVVNALAQILDRHEIELTGPERAVPSFIFIEECRALDKAEIIGLLRTLGIEQFSIRPYTKFDPSVASVKQVRSTRDTSRQGKIFKCLRPGYRRESDQWTIRRAWVEVFGEEPTNH